MYRDRGGWGVFLMLGALIGAVAALLLGTDEEGNTKKPVKVKVKKTKVYLHDFKQDHLDPVKEVFGEKTREAKAAFDEAVERFENKLAAVKGSIESLDRDKYNEVVNDVIADLKKSSGMTTGQLKRLGSYLKNDYSEIISSFDRGKTRKGKA
jgi:gas vesicle protein